MKLLFCTLALLTTMAPAMAQNKTASPGKVKNPLPTVKLKSGIIVTPIARPASDLERIMDVKMWRFNVQPPALDTIIVPQLEWRVPGKESQRVGGGGGSFFHQKNTDLLVGVAPVNNSFLDRADKWKIYYRAHDRAYEPGPEDITATSETNNPIKDLISSLSQYQTRYGVGRDYALPQSNGDIPLITIYGEAKDLSDERPVIAELVLVLTAQNPEPAKL